MDEAKLIASCKAGNLTDFDPLYTANVEPIYRYLLRRTLVREIAEDLTSTVFMKALESIRSFDPSLANFRTWLYRIARNSLIDHYRSPARKTQDIETVWDLASDEVVSLETERTIDAAELHRALATLKPATREIVMLRIWDDLSYKEIASLTGTSEGNAKVIFSRAIAELRTKLPSFLLLLLFPKIL